MRQLLLMTKKGRGGGNCRDSKFLNDTNNFRSTAPMPWVIETKNVYIYTDIMISSHYLLLSWTKLHSSKAFYDRNSTFSLLFQPARTHQNEEIDFLKHFFVRISWIFYTDIIDLAEAIRS